MSPFRTPLLLPLSFVVGCSQSLIVAEYPVDVQAPSYSDEAGGDRSMSKSHYWSAFVQMENQDIPHLWEASGLDYILITANVTIPTMKSPISRTIPLFTLEKGAMRTESGVDLLKKIPLTGEARDQVAVEIKVVHLKNKRAMEVARKILDRVSDLAKPFLSNYPEAARILESAVTLIADTTESTESNASSIKKVIDPDAVNGAADLSQDQSSLIAFFLMPIRLRRDLRGKGKNAAARQTAHERECRTLKTIERCGTAGWVHERISGETLLVECNDKSGFLCLRARADKGTETKNEPKSRELVDSDGKTTGKGLLLQWVQWADSSADLQDVETVWTDAAEQLARAKKRLDELNAGLELCDEGKERDRSKCEDLERQYSAADAAYQSLGDEVLRIVRGVAVGDSGTSYRDGRLDGIVYVTIKFKRTSDVYDPLVLLPDARGDCDRLTSDAVDRAQEYFGANVDFFTEDDANSIRATFRVARDYIDIRQSVAEGALLDALRRIGSLMPVLDGGVAEGSRSRGSLDANRESVRQCFDDFVSGPESRVLVKIWRLASAPPSSASAGQRADLIVYALQLLATLLDDTLPDFSKSGGLGPKSADSAVVRMLFEEARATLGSQARIFSKGVGDCATASGLVDGISAACSDCVEKIRAACVGDGDALRKLDEQVLRKQLEARAPYSPPLVRESSLPSRR